MLPVSPCFLVQEGTELFKGQNYRQAGARYSKALTHAAKMFDLSAEEQKEVHAVQLSLYLNLAQCYLKLQSWDQVRHGGNNRRRTNGSPPALLSVVRSMHVSVERVW